MTTALALLTRPSEIPLRSPLPLEAEHRYGQNHRPISEALGWRLSHEYADLPTGYAFIGGVARMAAFATLRGAQISTRDTDIAAFPELAADTNPDTLHNLSREYMPDDYAHGHGIRVEDTIEHYFNSRDFTINQLMVAKNEGDTWDLYYSDQAAIDIRQGAVRPTVMEYNPEHYFGQKLVIKALLMRDVLRRDGVDARIAGIDLRRAVPDGQLSDFWVSLGLQKAFEWGGDMPDRYVHGLQDVEEYSRRTLRNLTDEQKVLRTAQRARRLNDYDERHFVFRDAAIEGLADYRRRERAAHIGDSILRYTSATGR